MLPLSNTYGWHCTSDRDINGIVHLNYKIKYLLSITMQFVCKALFICAISKRVDSNQDKECDFVITLKCAHSRWGKKAHGCHWGDDSYSLIRSEWGITRGHAPDLCLPLNVHHVMHVTGYPLMTRVVPFIPGATHSTLLNEVSHTGRWGECHQMKCEISSVGSSLIRKCPVVLLDFVQQIE